MKTKLTSAPKNTRRSGYCPGAGRKPDDPSVGDRVNFTGCCVAPFTNWKIERFAARRGTGLGQILDQLADTLPADGQQETREYLIKMVESFLFALHSNDSTDELRSYARLIVATAEALPEV